MMIKALSVKMPWAHLIAEGSKTVEVRSRPTKYRGPLLICVSLKPQRIEGSSFIPNCETTVLSWRVDLLGHAIAIVDVTNCTMMSEVHEKAALVEAKPGLYAWTLSNVRKITPFPVKGKLGLFNVEVPNGAR